MSYQVVMPQLGLTMTEGSVTSWLKKPGDWIEKGEIWFTVETDKVEMEVESPASGYLQEQLAEPGFTVPVGTTIATLAEVPPASLAPVYFKPAKENTPTPAAVEQAPEPVVTVQPGASAAESPASPRARRLAKELGVNLREVAPSGNHRISEEDVRKHYDKTHNTSDSIG